MRRSSKAIDKTAPEMAVRRRWAVPNPRTSLAIEVGGGESSDLRAVVVVREGLTSERLATEEPPPALDQVEPG